MHSQKHLLEIQTGCISLQKEERLYKTHAAIYVKNLLNKPKEV